ncbi:TPA: MFS transporter [Listeria monocytogenes]|uniref:MFS transporter n=1 Tax=Listeria monocytogenes TaxID=1639 RepID=UPI000875A686|nr:MFS transporter [Listeria monocytogenes]EAC7004230.1 MFS transporter [Listeria monocytogenes]EAF3890177.1 MFS transporter [Listeria monocytogenes]EAG6867586.1 MFS transporter [Listeria monocytogenes]EHG1760145.1 MFS transporter [Listeria monocytogenes]EHK2446804.1 MFS transporter [Listeria monocytogenes]
MNQVKGEKHSLMVLLVLFIGYTSVYVDKYTIGISLVTVSQDLGFDPSQKGLILSAFFLGYTLFQIPMGYLNNRIGARPVLAISIIIVGLFLIIFGFGYSLLFLVVIRVLSGALGHAGYPPSVSNYISLHIPLNKRGFAQSAMLASSGFAAFIGPLLIAQLLLSVGWRNTYYWIGIAVILIGFLILIVVPKAPKIDLNAQKEKIKVPFSELLKDKQLWILLLSALFINAANYGLTSWLASYLNEVRGISISEVSYISSLAGLCILIAGVVGGYFISRFFKGKEPIIIFAFCVLGAFAVYGVYLFEQLALSVICLCLCNIFLIMAFTTLMGLPHKLFQQSHIATKYAAINSGGVLGGFFAPMIIGDLVNATNSYQSAFLFLALTLLASGLIVLAIKKDQ